MWALVFISLNLVLVCEGFQLREDPAFPVGSKQNPGKSCKDIKERGGTVTKTYYVTLGQQTLLVHCDQDTAGGGWTLVYSYTFTDLSYFDESWNALTPRPNWKIKKGEAQKHNTPISTTPPKSETDYNAMDFNLWKTIGTSFMIKSNINNWVACDDHAGGSLVSWRPGTIKCKLVKDVTGKCSDVVPDTFSITYPGSVAGPLLYITDKSRKDGVRAYYLLESDTKEAFPTHDPCGNDSGELYADPDNPRGNIYIR